MGIRVGIPAFVIFLVMLVLWKSQRAGAQAVFPNGGPSIIIPATGAPAGSPGLNGSPAPTCTAVAGNFISALGSSGCTFASPAPGGISTVTVGVPLVGDGSVGSPIAMPTATFVQLGAIGLNEAPGAFAGSLQSLVNSNSTINLFLGANNSSGAAAKIAVNLQNDFSDQGTMSYGSSGEGEHFDITNVGGTGGVRAIAGSNTLTVQRSGTTTSKFSTLCKSTITSSGGTGTYSDATCVTTASRCTAQDITSPNTIPHLQAPGSGSIAYSSVGATDSVIVGCD